MNLNKNKINKNKINKNKINKNKINKINRKINILKDKLDKNTNKINKINRKINILKDWRRNTNKIEIKRNINILKYKRNKIKLKKTYLPPGPLPPPIYPSFPISPYIIDKTLVLYVFHEYNDRVKHFIKNCIFYDENIDFIIISNNKKNCFETPDYVTKLFRNNIGYDFGGWSDALLTNNLYKDYKNFIFVNSSVIGPFIASDYKGKWTDIYLNGLQNNVKLFGSTINTCCDPLNMSHVQSYIFSMNETTLKYLINCEIFSITNYAKTFKNAIWNKEVLMSRKIIENNWNIGSLLSYYNGVDFTFHNKKPYEYGMTFCYPITCIMEEKYKDRLWDEEGLVFIKGNRNLNIKSINKIDTPSIASQEKTHAHSLPTNVAAQKNII